MTQKHKAVGQSEKKQAENRETCIQARVMEAWAGSWDGSRGISRGGGRETNTAPEAVLNIWAWCYLLG